MKLSKEEERMLSGKLGPAKQKAMELLVAVGKVYGADCMIPVAGAHIVSPSMLLWATGQFGQWGRELVAESVKGARRFEVDTTINPAFFDADLLKKFGYPQSYVDDIRESIASDRNLYSNLGVIPTYSCCPFFLLSPRKGIHLAAAEMNVVLYSNSLVGAMTNRESGVTAMAAALTGRTPLHGMHFPQNRLGQVLVELKDDLSPLEFSASEYSTLSYYVAGQARNRTPVYTGLPTNMSSKKLLYFSSGHSSSGALSMFHAVGITPEAPTIEVAFGHRKPTACIEVGRQELKATSEALCSATGKEVDWVILGCPHAALEQIQEVAKLLGGRKMHRGVRLILATSETIRSLAQSMGLVDTIKDAGGYVVSGVCPVSFPRRSVPPGFKMGVVCTDRAGIAHLLKTGGVEVWFGSIEKCISAAITGSWEAG